MLLKEIKLIFHRELKNQYPKEEIDNFFYLLIEHYLGLEKFVLALQPDLVVNKKEEQPLFEGLAGLKLEKPIQYITGLAYFMDMEFKVTPDVLIPRPETEQLVHWALDDYDKKLQGSQKASSSPLRILDIGTGSGCIAVALAKLLPNSEVSALDISEKALVISQQNAKKNGVEVRFVLEDIFSVMELKQKFDIIISNPPYVRELEKKDIKNNILKNEPHLALFVPDQNPLKYYKKIIDLAAYNLVRDGKIYLEINQYLGEETRQLLRAKNFKDIELRKDLYGNYRMLRGTF